MARREQRGIISNGVKKFIPYYYIPDKGFYGGKWHWMRGVQDCSSNYEALEDPKLGKFIEASERIDLPIVFEEELRFTETFIRKTKNLKIIIPHLGMLGGNPIDFLNTFRARENVYFDTALASPDTVMNFIEKIGYERPLFGSNIPFGTMEPHGEPVDPKNHTYLCQCLGGSPAGERNPPKHGRSIAERAPIWSYAFLCMAKSVLARRSALQHAGVVYCVGG